MNIVNPYAAAGRWLKGTLHVHTDKSPCGHYPLEAVVATYADRILKYDFIAITDHRILTDVSAYEHSDGIVVFSGVEYKDESFQTLGINITEYCDDPADPSNHAAIFSRVNEQGGLNVICHPHIHTDEYWPLEKLLKLDNYLAIEVYNHNVKMNNSGRALAADRWDELLSAGKRVFGMANDDMHHLSRLGGAFLMAKAASKDKAGILAALKRGCFYASTGIIVNEIEFARGRLAVAVDAARTPPVLIRFVGNKGALLRETVGATAEYCIRGDERYVRVELRREDGAMAWLQPFFVD